MTNFKRFLTLLFVTILAVNVWGGEASFAPSDFSGQGTSGTGSAISATKNGVTFACDKGYGTTQFRCYQNGTITISSSNTITAIAFTFSGSYTGGLSTSYTGLSTTSWSQKLGSQARITACTVTFSGGGSTHTLSSAVSPTGAGTVTLGSTTVAEGSTTTATATANTGYVFSSWSISGTGASLSSTSTNPTTVTMGTANATVTANFVPKTAASITLSVAGSTSTVSGKYVGDSYTPPTSVASCSGKTFVGWSKVAISTPSATKPTSNYHEIGESVTLTASQTFYAVYATASGGGTWEKATSVAAGDYLIVCEDQLVAFDGSLTTLDAASNTQAVTITAGELSLTNAANYIFTIAAVTGGYSIKSKSGIYIGRGSDANGMEESASALVNTITITGGDADIVGAGGAYLRYNKTSGQERFRYFKSSTYTSQTAIQLYTNNTSYSGYTTSCVACSTPTLNFAGATLTKKMSESGFTYAATATGNTLGATISYSSSNPSKATVNSSGVVTLLQSTIDGSPITITATLPYTENALGTACQDEVTATYTLNIQNDITWIVNEAVTTAGAPTTAANYNGTISAIPTTPGVPSACSTKSFVGWTTEANWDSDDAPDPLYTDLAEFPAIKENKTFYAVFASTTSGDLESTLTQTLQYDTWTHSGTTTNMSTKKYRLFGNGAYIQSESNVNWDNLSQVVVYGGYYGDSECTGISIRKDDGSTTWLNGDVEGNSQSKANTFSGGASLTGSSKLRVYSTCGNGTGGTGGTGVRISKVEIYEMVATTVGTGYVTRCCTEWDDPSLTYDKYSIEVGDPDATKTLTGTEHGTLTFSSSNEAIAEVNSSGAVHAVSPGNVTITANWSKSGSYCSKQIPINFTITGAVTVTFDANGGTGSMASQTGIPYNTSTPLNTMSGLTAPAGMTFIGWNTQADGKGDSYADGASVKLTTNTTLYAQWGVAYTITLHRSGSTQEIVLLNTQFPYTLPVAESDYCDAWQFDGWSASAVANNSTSYEKVIKATTAEDAHFYAVYRGDSYSTEAFARISSADQLTSGAEYILAANSTNKRFVLTNTFTTTNYNYGEMTTTEIAESGKDFFFSSVIPASSIYYISGSEDNWEIKNKAQNKYINLANADNLSYDWYTTYNTNRTYKITPNGLYWTVLSNASVTKKYLDATKKDTPTRVVFTVYQYHSGALMIYKKGTATAYHYTSTPSGEGCALPCTDCGAQFTYPSMEKSISSKPFSNPIVYTGTPNMASKSFSSNDDDVAEVDENTGEVTIKGIGEVTITMTQLRDNTDPSHPVCGITISYDITVTSPSLEVVEVTGDDKIIVEHDFNGITEAEVDSSKLDIKGQVADDIFISKYYEAASEMKLIGLYNGTTDSIDLSQLRIRTSRSGGAWGGSDNHGEAYLGHIVKLGEDYPNYLLPPFTEIVLWSNNESGDNNGGNAELCYCIDMTINKKKYNYDDMTAGKVPNWYRIGNTSGGTDSDGNKTFNFNGDDAIILERSTDNWSTWTAIDLFGAGTPEAPVADPTGSGNGYVQKQSFNDTPGGWYWDATSAAGTELSTNRFYLTRLSSVRSGTDAVEQNATSFVTLGTEWSGEGIGGGTNMSDYCGSGELFSEVATYDFAKYYTNYIEYKDKFTASDNGDGTLTVQFNSGELDKLACKKIKISVKDAVDNTKTAEVEYRVPIIVKNTTDVTQSTLFNKHDKDECKVCDVAIVSGGVLTKSKPTTPADVAADRDQMYNIDVYGGGELYIPSGTTYTINTLTVRSTGDAVGIVDVQGKLNRNDHTLFHTKRFRAKSGDPLYRWYYFSLPYDCNVSDVTFTNGDPALHEVDFEIDWYDGASRASSQADGNWRSISTHPDYPNIIKAGYGYTIAVEIKSGHDNVGLLFPMANFKEATQIDVPVGNWGAGDDDITVNHKGWNVVGNPFLTRYKAQTSLDVNGELRVGYLTFSDGKWVQDNSGDKNINYATVPQDGGKSGYTQEALTNHLFNPFQSFIIQVGGDAERSDLAVQLKNTHKDKRPASIVQRKESDYEVDEATPVWLRLNLSNANKESDHTTILISDNYTAEYDMQRDLAKWRGSSYRRYTRPVLASVYGGYELVFDALPDSIVADRVPLTYYSRDAGTMAFELSSAYNWQALEEVILYDTSTGAQHNLLKQGKYEFSSAAGEVGDRFYISAKVNRRKEPEFPTGLSSTDMQNVRMFVDNRNIMLNGLTEGTQVYVFDMSGRLVGRQVATQSFMSISVPAMGIYNIRLIGTSAGTTLRALVQH